MLRHDWHRVGGLLALLGVLLSACLEESRGEQLRAYANAEGIVGVYTEQEYAEMYVGYVYDRGRDALLLVLDNSATTEAYILERASLSFGALLVNGNKEDRQHLRSLKENQEELLQSFQEALEVELEEMISDIEANITSQDVAKTLTVMRCKEASTFIELLLCLLARVLESGVVADPMATGSTTKGEISGTASGGSTGVSTHDVEGADVSGGSFGGRSTGGTDASESVSTLTDETENDPSHGDTDGGVGGVDAASIYGKVWFDKDLNNLQSAEEPHLAGVTVYLDTNNNGELDESDISTVTDSEGRYEFAGLIAGESYAVREVLTLGWTNHYVTQGSTPFAVPRIVKGEPTDAKEHPYILGMSNGLYACGAALITPSVALTAGHCVLKASKTDQVDAEDIILRWGADRFGSGGQIVRVLSYESHPGFELVGTWTWPIHDIALLQLATPLPQQPRIFLPEKEDWLLEHDMQAAVAIGWGEIDTLHNIPAVLQKATVNIIEHKRCKDMRQRVGIVNDNMLCTSAAVKGVCRGDSGGPLYGVKHKASHDIRHVQIGIISATGAPGRICNDPDYPDVYTRVSKYMTYIEQHVKPEPSQASRITLDPGANQVNFANFH